MSGFKPYDASSSGSGGGGGGGGVFQPESRVNTTIPIGQTGDLITITAPTGKVIKVTYLATLTSSQQSGISLIVNGNTFIDQENLLDFTPVSTSSSRFFVGALGDSAAGLSRVRISEVYCTSLIVNKNAGNTTELMNIVYEIGEVK